MKTLANPDWKAVGDMLEEAIDMAERAGCQMDFCVGPDKPLRPMRKCFRCDFLTRAIKMRDRLFPERKFYVSTFCNMPHRVKTGRPIGHECRTIPPAALAAEMEGDFEKAIEIMKEAR